MQIWILGLVAFGLRVIINATVVRALVIAVAVNLAFAIGHSAQPATAVLAAPPDCVVHLAR